MRRTTALCWLFRYEKGGGIAAAFTINEAERELRQHGMQVVRDRAPPGSREPNAWDKTALDRLNGIKWYIDPVSQ